MDWHIIKILSIGIILGICLPWWLRWERICLQWERPGFDPWVGKIRWRRERLPTPVFRPGEFHGLYSPWGRKESNATERLSPSHTQSGDNQRSQESCWETFSGRELTVPWASLVAQLVRNPPTMRETWAPSLGGEDPLEKGKATHSSLLAWRIPGTIQSMGLQRGGHDWVTNTHTQNSFKFAKFFIDLPNQWAMFQLQINLKLDYSARVTCFQFTNIALSQTQK